MTKLSLASGLAMALLAPCGLAATPVPQPAPAAQEPAPEFPAGVDVVTVDVVVLDSAGKPVEGLSEDDFVVSDEGRIRGITSFEAVTLPESPPGPPPLRSRVSTNLVPAARVRPERTFAIVFDDVHLAPGRSQIAKRAVEKFMRTGLSPGDRVVLVPTSGGAWWTAVIPDGREDIVAALDRLQGMRQRDNSVERISDWEAMQLYIHRDQQVGAQVIRRYYEYRIIPELPGGAERQAGGLTDIGEGHPLIRAKAAEVYQTALARMQATFRALERVADSLAGVKGRKSIVLVSEGFIQEPERPEFREAVEAARRANAVIYFLDAKGLTGIIPTADAQIADPTDERDLGAQVDLAKMDSLGAVSLAVETGGFAIRNNNDLNVGLSRIDRQSRAYYLIGFPITGVKRDGEFHKLEVKVARPGMKVVARKGYYAPSDEPPKPQPPDTLDPKVRTAIDSPFDRDSIPLRIASYALGSEGEETKVIFTVDVDPRHIDFEHTGERYEGKLMTVLLVSSRDTGESWHREKEVELSLPPPFYQQVQERWMPLLRDLELKPGTYQALFYVRDDRGQRVGTVRHEFEVPAPQSLHVSTPILTDVLQQGQGTAPRPIPLARRSFPIGSTLYYIFQVFGAETGSQGPQVATGYHVESIGGDVIGTQARVPLSPGPGGELSQMYALNTQGMAPGDYIIVLQVDDQVSGQTLEVFDPFTVVGSAAAVASSSD
jgi:VWFA-related protein